MKDIEARLERSLRKQVAAPTLDGRFDAAVWARIGAASKPAAMAMPARANPVARWLKFGNGVALAVAVLLVVVYGVREASAIASGVELPALPAEVSAFDTRAAQAMFGWAITIGALVFGIMFTPLGSKLRREFI